MSLNYELNKIKNWQEVTQKKVDPSVTQEEINRAIMHGASYYYEEDDEGNKTYTSYMNPITNALIWGTLGIGMGRITEANYHEFWLRLLIDDSVNGFRITEVDDDGTRKSRSLTLEEVRDHIGLRTNVTKETKTWMYNKLLREATRRKEMLDKEEKAA